MQFICSAQFFVLTVLFSGGRRVQSCGAKRTRCCRSRGPGRGRGARGRRARALSEISGARTCSARRARSARGLFTPRDGSEFCGRVRARVRARAASAAAGRSLPSAGQSQRGPALGRQSAPPPAAGPLIRARVHSSGRGGRGRAPATLFGRRPV